MRCPVHHALSSHAQACCAANGSFRSHSRGGAHQVGDDRAELLQSRAKQEARERLVGGAAAGVAPSYPLVLDRFMHDAIPSQARESLSMRERWRFRRFAVCS